MGKRGQFARDTDRDMKLLAFFSVVMAQSCIDKNPNCGSMHHFCTRLALLPTMKEACSRTCGFCEHGAPETFVFKRNYNPNDNNNRNVETTMTTSSVSTTISTARLLTGSIITKCDDHVDKAPICAKHKHLCMKDKYEKRMRQKCPFTCCTTESRQSPSPVQLKMATTTVGAVACYDAASDKCPGLEVYCKRPSTAKTMRKKCAKTCGYCGETMEMTTTQMQPIIQLKIASQPCLNKSGDDFCSKYGKYCAAAKYEQKMKKQCNKQCGYC